MSRILVCGDSYCVTDPDYPNLHWTEKILSSSPDYEIINLAYGGCSNALIVLQLLQGLKMNPDFVILSFTNDGRYETDNDVDALPSDESSAEIASYIKRRFITNQWPDRVGPHKIKIINQYKTIAASDTFEKLKNYFFISFCLQTLALNQINFCFSLGGFEYQQDYNALIRSNFLKNILNDYHQKELSTNLWYHGHVMRPYFHVNSDHVQSLFANECMNRLQGI